MLLTSALLSLLRASTQQIPFNLHVLSLPPAFVLSQDQTLMLIDENSILSIITHKEFLRFLYHMLDFIFFIIYRPHILLNYIHDFL